MAKKYKFKYDDLVVGKIEKGKWCKENNVDLLIEDNLDHAKSANTQSIITILLRTNYNKDYSHPLNYFGCCWLEIQDIINSINKEIK